MAKSKVIMINNRKLKPDELAKVQVIHSDKTQAVSQDFKGHIGSLRFKGGLQVRAK